jgi:hypothetical protein
MGGVFVRSCSAADVDVASKRPVVNAVIRIVCLVCSCREKSGVWRVGGELCLIQGAAESRI